MTQGACYLLSQGLVGNIYQEINNNGQLYPFRSDLTFRQGIARVLWAGD